MGQYFYFKHQNGSINKKPLPWNFGLPWLKSFDRLQESEQIKIFKEIINLNNWENGEVSAVGDYGFTLIYNPELNTIEDQFNPNDD
jgi:hypothetical protein